MKAKKKFGQHFLTDKHIARKIVDSLTFSLEKNKINCLEIGGGKGILTEFLLSRNEYDVFVAEIDNEAVEYLKNKFPGLKIIHQDILKVSFDDYFEAPLPIIGNIPYNITGPIFFKILDYREMIPQFVAMIQKEVAERIVAKQGSKTYGILSVLLQAYYDIEYLFSVNENVFSPPPKVKSAVIRMTKKNKLSDIEDFKKFKQLVKTAFNQRRKTLRNALKKLYLTENVPAELMKKRAEQLSVQEFIELCKTVR